MTVVKAYGGAAEAFSTLFSGVSLESYRQHSEPEGLRSYLEAFLAGDELHVQISSFLVADAERGNRTIKTRIFYVERRFHLADRAVEHRSFHVRKDFRRQGISRFVNGRQLAFYKAHGIAAVMVTAKAPDGLLAWAHHGFDFAYPATVVPKLRAHLLQLLQAHGADDEHHVVSVGTLERSWEFAFFDAKLADGQIIKLSPGAALVEQGVADKSYDLGEYALLCLGPWDGIIRLADSDPTWIQHQKCVG